MELGFGGFVVFELAEFFWCVGVGLAQIPDLVRCDLGFGLRCLELVELGSRIGHLWGDLKSPDSIGTFI